MEDLMTKVTDRFSDREIAMLILYYHNIYKGDVAIWFGATTQDFSLVIERFDCLMRQYKPLNHNQIIKMLSDKF